MITTIGFLPRLTEKLEMTEFILNEEVKTRLDYLQIPLLPNTSESTSNEPNKSASNKPASNKSNASETEEKPEIKITDNILFCTPQTEEISHLSFYGYDNKEIFFHHDLLIFSTILSSCFIKDKLVGIATYEPDIMLYDFTVNFPIFPQHLLIGHNGPVTAIKNKYEKLMSASDDKTIIEWDPIELRLRSQKSYDVSIERFDFEGNSLVFGSKNYLNINNENISLDNELEQLQIKDNLVYVSDCVGRLVVYDVRMPAKALINQKIHDASIVDFCLAKEWIVTTSMDQTVKLWKIEEGILGCKSVLDQESTVFSLGYNEFESTAEVFAGNDDNFVFGIELKAQEPSN